MRRGFASKFFLCSSKQILGRVNGDAAQPGEPSYRIINKVAMQLKLELPDETASQIGAGHKLSRAALEGLVTEGCRTHRLSDSAIREWPHD